MRKLVLFVLGCFAVASLVRVDFAFTVAFFLGFTYVLVRVLPKRWERNVAGDRQFLDRAFPGDVVEVVISVRNRGLLPVPWVEAYESMPFELASTEPRRRIFSLGPRTELKASYHLTCRARGFYPIGPMTLRTGDVLGIRERDFSVLAADHLIVYPRVVPLEQLGLPTSSPLAVLPHRAHLFEDPTRVRGVREYRPGDSQRRIHWTAMARTGNLLVRQYEPAVARETVVCLDLDAGGYPRQSRRTGPELAITAAASIAAHAINREDLPAGLLTEAYDPLIEHRTEVLIPPGSGKGHLMSLLEMLARLATDQEFDFPGLLQRRAPELPWGSTLVVITGSVTPELTEMLVYLRARGFTPSLVLVQPDPISLQSIQLVLRDAGIRMGVVWNEPDLKIM